MLIFAASNTFFQLNQEFVADSRTAFCFGLLWKYEVNLRGNHWSCFVKKGVLKNVADFTGKHLCWILSFKKKFRLRCFPVLVTEATLSISIDTRIFVTSSWNNRHFEYIGSIWQILQRNTCAGDFHGKNTDLQPIGMQLYWKVDSATCTFLRLLREFSK